MNRAIRRAAGDYVIFMNAGDRFASPDVLARFDRFQRGEDLIYGDVLFGIGNRYYKFEYPDALTPAFLYSQNLCQQTMFYRRDLFDRFGEFNLRFRVVADYEYLLRLWFSDSCTMKHFPCVTSIYLGNGFSTKDRPLLERERRVARLCASKNPKAGLSMLREALRSRIHGVSNSVWKNLIRRMLRPLFSTTAPGQLISSSSIDSLPDFERDYGAVGCRKEHLGTH